MVKSQHYVPVFYLNNFVDSSGELHIYDREKNRLFTCRPKKICQSKFLYEIPWKNANVNLGKYVMCNDIENYFSVCEGHYSTLLKRLLKICVPSQNPYALICSPEDKEELISFIINLYIRNPWTMECFKMHEIPKELRNHPDANIINKLLEGMNWGGADSLLNYSVMWSYLVEHDEGGLIKELKQEIEKLKFTFFHSKSGNFITSNFPSCIGYAKNEKLFAYLPLSPCAAVLFGDSFVSKKDNNRMRIINAHDTLNINRIYSLFDTKQVKYIINHSDLTL